MPSHDDQYIPGVCNIGRAEIRQRKLVGWISLAVTAGAWLALAILDVAPAWRLTLFVPASIAATGFLQAAWHFCATFGVLGRSNFGPSAGKTDTVEQAEFRRQDRRTALRIIALSALAGAAVAAIAYYWPM
jgi:fatty acid desaturase